MKHCKRLFVIFFFFVFTNTALSQTQPIFQKIGQSQGLSSSRITGIVKEKNGFIWISTQNGLNRYDGNSVKVYNKQNSNIEFNDISSIYLDSKNRIWLTSYGSGINLYDKKNDRFVTFKNALNDKSSIISNRINTIIEDSKGFLWIGTEKGLSLFDEKLNKFHSYSYENQQLNIVSIYEDKNKNLWLGTFANGLLLFNPKTKTFQKITDHKSLLTSSINVISDLNPDKILLGTSGSGLLSLDLKTKKISTFNNDNSSSLKKVKIVRSIKKDSKDNLWIGSDGYGLFKLKYPNSKEPIISNYMYNSQLASSIAGNAIYVISEDDDSNIWIGTAWNGISVLDMKNQTEIMLSDIVGFHVNPVLSIFENHENLFLGLDGNGLNIYNKKNRKIEFYDEQKLGAKYVQKIVQTKNKNIWLGTFGNGLINLDKNRKITNYKNIFNDEKSLSFDDVRDIIEDEKENLWIATWGGGLNYFDIKKAVFSRFNLPNNNLVSILKDKEKIWVASYGGGLMLFDINTKKVVNFSYKETDTNSISSNNIFSILKDTHGYLWIGTSGAGVNRMNLTTNKIERFQNFQNNNYKTISAIVEDDENNIWFASKKGIIKFDYANDSFTTFNNLSGDFHINSCFKDKQGFLYFGGVHGVIKINPKILTKTNIQPKVKFRSFKIFNKEVNIGEKEILKQNIESTKQIHLKHFHNVITFEFSALKFPSSANCEYAIQMENFDDDWRNIGKDRTATYTNLSPGDYIFKVKSKEIGSNWGSSFTSIKIRIEKPIWLSWWAYIIYGTLIFIVIYFLRKYILAWGKLKSSLELEKITHEKDTEVYNLKQQFFTNISHEIRTPVTLILSSINRLFDKEKIKDSKQVKAAQTIRRNSNLLLRLVNELLDVRKLETNDIVLNISHYEFISFVKEIYYSFSEVAIDRNIKYSFKTDINKMNLWFDKNQLEKVIFNLISNAFKFTKDGGVIEIKLEETEKKIIVTVKDTGIGLSLEDQKKIFNRFYQVKHVHSENNRGFGLGLSIVKDIVKLHKGEIHVSSQLKKGSSFELMLQKGKTHFENSNELAIENTTKEESITILQNKVLERNKKHETILIVEDNAEIQEFLKETLEADNYSIIQAYTGVEGLKLVTKIHPDLIISDVMMPEMDGVELTQKVKANTTTSHIPIIILTAKTSSQDQTIGYEKGADDYISKPFDEEVLKIRIRNLLNTRKLLKSKFVNGNVLNPKEIGVSSKDQLFLEKLYKCLEQNLESNNVKSEIISEKMGMSYSSLYKKIKALTGLTYVEFIRDYRLSVAKQLIEEMGYSVSDACYKVGYSDRKYFSKLFKNKFKQNPSFFLKV